MLQNAGALHILTCKCASRHSGVPDRIFQNVHENLSFCTVWLTNVLRATSASHFAGSNLPKCARENEFLHGLTYKCALRHSGVAFCPIESSKMCTRIWVFAHFDLQMCFAPQRRSILPDRIFQNVHENMSFSTFWLTNVLRATAACHFSPVCWTATSAPAALARLLFEHQEPRIIGKTQRFSASLTFRARVPAFYWLYTRVDLLSADLTSLLCLTPLLCFSTLHIVGS